MKKLKLKLLLVINVSSVISVVPSCLTKYEYDITICLNAINDKILICRYLIKYLNVIILPFLYNVNIDRLVELPKILNNLS